MDDNLKQKIKDNLKASIRKFFKGKDVKNTHILDNIFPAERRIRSLIGGLETSLGTTVWEPLSKTLAKQNGFTVLNKKLLKPKPLPRKVSDEISILKELRESKDNSISMNECIMRLREAALKSDRNDLEFEQAPSGNGVDVYLKKDEKEYVFDIKTNQVNQGKGKALNLQLLEWYAYRFCENPNVQFEARIAFPFNPYKNKTWWQSNGARAYPLEQGKDAWVEDEFWDFCSGQSNTWSEILQIFIELGNENFGKEFEDIFYQKNTRKKKEERRRTDGA